MRSKLCSGSVTVEAAIVFPLFLMVLLSMLMLLKICRTYNTMQFALQDTARKMAGVAYLYHLSGVNDLAITLEKNAENAKPILDGQIAEVMEFANAFSGFAEMASDSSSQQNGTANSEYMLQQLQGLSENWKGIQPIIKEILNNPQKQAGLLAAVFGHEMVSEVRNQVFRALAHLMLQQSLTLKTQVDVSLLYHQLGIVDSESTIDFSESQAFSDGNTLELVIKYHMTGMDMFGIFDQIPLCNRVKMVGWTGGVGAPQRSAFEGNTEQFNQIEVSLWNSYDDNKQYKTRGTDVELLELAGLQPGANSPILAEKNNQHYSAYADYVTLNTETMEATAYQFFTLNSFMKTYQDSHAAVGKRMAENADKLLMFDIEMADERMGYGQAKTLKRVLILIVPENAEPWVQEEFQRTLSQLYASGIDQIQLIGAYGDYILPKSKDGT